MSHEFSSLYILCCEAAPCCCMQDKSKRPFSLHLQWSCIYRQCPGLWLWNLLRLHTGSDWDGVNFPHSSPDSAVFVFVARMVLITHQGFLLLLTRAPTSRLPLQSPLTKASGLRKSKRMWGNTAGTADSNWANRYSILYGVMLSNKIKRKLWKANTLIRLLYAAIHTECLFPRKGLDIACL